MKRLDWSINVECDLLKKGKQNEIFMMHSYIHNENDIALEGLRRCQTWYPFHKNHIQSKFTTHANSFMEEDIMYCGIMFLFWAEFCHLVTKQRKTNPRKDLWGEWHNVAIFWGKKVKITTLLTKMEYDLKRFSFRYKTIDYWNIWHSCSSS